MGDEASVAAYLEACFILDQLSGQDSEETFADYNDLPGTTHADVLSLLDRAIAKAKAATHDRPPHPRPPGTLHQAV